MNRDEIIDKATKVMHADVCCPCDPKGCDWTHTREARHARWLADMGLLARPLPTREEIASQVASAMDTSWDDAMEYAALPSVAADAVLDLLKGQDE